MPRAAAARPRKMFPPPTTMAISTPPPCAATTWRAIDWHTAGSTPYCRSPMRASPDSLSRTRWYTGSAVTAAPASPGRCLPSGRSSQLLAQLVPGEPSDPDVLADAGDGLRDELTHGLLAIPERLLVEDHLLVPLPELTLDDL